MTSTYDHRIIQGAESGQFLQVVEAYLQGEHGFYEQVFSDLGVEIGAGADRADADARPPRRAETKTEPAPAVAGRAEPRAAAGRPGRDVADQGAPHARPPGRAAGPARLRARGRPRARPRAAEADARDHGQDPGLDPARRRARARRSPTSSRTCARPTAARSPTRSSTSPRTASASGCARRSRPARSASRSSADEKVALLRRLTQVDSLERFMHKAYLGQKQFSVEGLDMTVPMLDEMIQLAAAEGAREVVIGMAHRGRLNVLAHNLGPRVRDDLPRVRGRVLDRGRDHDPAGRHRRRQVPPRRPGHLPVRRRRERARAAGVQPVAPRVRRPGRRGRHARGADLAPGHARDAGHQRRGADHPARRRRLPGPGRRGGDVQPAGARRLHGRRLAAPDPEQPGRLHDRPGRLALHALGLGPREGLRRPDLPRQRRRRRRLHLRRPARVRVPPGVRPRRPDRPDRLPPLRPQRGRRAGVHAAGDDGQDQGQEAGARALRGGAGGRRARSRRRRPTRSPTEIWDDLARRHRELKEQLASAGDEQPTGGYELDRSASPEVKTAVSTERLQTLNEELLRVPEGFTVHPKLVKQLERRRDGDRPRRRHRLGAGRVAGLRVAADRGHAGPPDRPGRRARHVLAAPPRAARPEDRPADLADPVAAGRAGADGAAQLAAERDRLPRLRVRLLDGGAGDARAVGGPVRRLRELGAGHHRPVHRLRAVEVGPDDASDAAAAARLRGLGPGALLRRAWSAS